jgi:hypothetical protein
MRVEVSPRRADVTPSIPQPITITVGNTSTVIGGYEILILGADPTWVELETDRISLFPDEVRSISGTISVPPGIPAGPRQVAVQVRELTAPYTTSVAELALIVPPAPAVAARIDPPSVIGGKVGQFTVLLENSGNTVVRADLSAEEAESQVAFFFDPERVVLAPGEHAVVDMTATGKRPWWGNNAPRLISVFLDDVPEDGFFADAEPPPPKHDDTTAATRAMFVQKARLTRGMISMLGLIAAITVFAVIITIALSKLVGQNAADRQLALQIAAAKAENGISTGTSTISGAVKLLTSQEPVPGVSVALYKASDLATPVATTATNQVGGYIFSNLDAGDYKLSYRGAGFLQLWYPTAADAGNASTVKLPAHHLASGLNVAVGGVPATLAGTVTGSNLSGATLYVEKSVSGASASGNSVVVAPPQQGAVSAAVTDTGAAIVKSVPIGNDGGFTLAGIPSPSRYLLVLAKPGFATSTQTIDVGAGEDRSSIQLTLSQGDGLIEGLVTSSSGPLPGVTMTASTGQVSASTVSLSEGPAGGFTLRNLPTPATYTVVASIDGYAPQTLSISLAQGQQLTGVQLTLSKSSGSMFGRVSVIQPGGSADKAGTGVSVVVTDGATTITTQTQSSAQNGHPAGFWRVTGLPVPGDYTATFSRSDLASQTVAVSIDAFGNITTGTGSSGLQARLKLATATVTGIVTQSNGGGNVCNTSTNALGEATVSLNSGSTTYTVTTASVPTGQCGKYVIPNVVPGSYTLTVSAGGATNPNSQSVQLVAGQVLNLGVTLARPASITGALRDSKGNNLCGWTVFLYKTADYPTTVTTTATVQSSGGQCVFKMPRVDAGSYILAAGSTPDAVNAQVTVSINVKPGDQYGVNSSGAITFTITVPV